MYKFYFLSFFLCSLFTVFSAKAVVSVNVPTAGTLEQVLFDQTDVPFAEIVDLTVTGTLNDVDIETIKTMSQTYALRNVDLSAANMVNNSLADNAFKNSNLKKLTIPASVTTLGFGCFQESMLESIILPTTNLKIIPTQAFTHNHFLKEMIIPEGVTSIGINAFVFCWVIKKITLPSTLTKLCEGAILGGAGFTAGFPLPLTDIYIKAATPPTMDPAGVCLGEGTWDICTLHVPAGSVDAYKANIYDGWYGFGLIKNVVELTTGVNSIQNNSLKVYSESKNSITVDGLSANALVSIYSVTGKLIKSINATSSKMTVSILNRGVYVVKSDSKVAKITL